MTVPGSLNLSDSSLSTEPNCRCMSPVMLITSMKPRLLRRVARWLQASDARWVGLPQEVSVGGDRIDEGLKLRLAAAEDDPGVRVP